MRLRITRLSSIANSLAQLFSPSKLFMVGEQGVWYDPSDTTTLFQDSAGTTPVTAVEQPVGLMLDKSKGLVLGSELYSGGEITLQPSTEVVFGSTVSGRWYRTIVPSGCQGNFGPGWNTTSSGTGVHYRLADGASFRIRNFGATPVTFTPTLRELPGNHAFQATATSRPVLSARYNLLERTEEFDNLYWSKTNATVSQNTETSPSGSLTADTFTATGANAVIFRSQSGTSGSFTFSVYLKRKTGSGNVSIEVGASSQVVAVTNQWQQFAITGTSNNFPGIRLAVSGDEVYIWGADLRVTNDALNQPAYQRVNTATDYDTTGFKPYLRFDGTDDWLQTNSIDFSSTDKMTVFAGVRKLSDAARGMVIELGNGAINTNQFHLSAPLADATSTYGFQSVGSVSSAGANTSGYLAPITNVVSGIGEIATDTKIIRVNGTQTASSTADQGTGNFGNYPLYIGRRGGTTLPFNGRIYGLIVRGAQSTEQQITSTENWLNQRTGAY